MNLAIVSQEYPPETAKGGIGTQAHAKAHGMARRGHTVHVISRSADGRASESEANGVRVIRLAGPGLQAHTEIADWIAYSAEVAAAIAALHSRAPLDLIEFPEWGCESYVHLLNRTQWNRIPSLIHLHGAACMLARTIGWPEPGSEFHRAATHMEGTCLRLADAVYSSSACSVQWCAREYGLDAKEIPVLHTGVDTTHFTPRHVARDQRLTIVFAGKVNWSKGVLVLLEAALNLAKRYPSLRVRMLGRAEAHVAEELRRGATAAGRPELLELPGFIGRDALPDEFSRADIFAAPSRYEGGPGFVYLEAMACGLPVVAAAGSGADEIVSDGKTGFLVPPQDSNALADVLGNLLDNAASRRVIGDAARRYVIEYADTERCLDALQAHYEGIMRRRESSERCA